MLGQTGMWYKWYMWYNSYILPSQSMNYRREGCATRVSLVAQGGTPLGDNGHSLS